jgi:AcrR family transcriptional regulator
MVTATQSEHTPRWKRRKESRPREILAAALELFVEHGFAATRLEDVARRAGVTKGTMYLYFPSKDDLFKAVVRENVVPAIEEGERRTAAFEGTSPDLIRGLVDGWWTNMRETRTGGLGKLMMAEAVNFPELARFYHDEVVSRGHAVFARALQRGVDSGEFRPVDVRAAVRLVVAPLLMSALWKHSFTACGAAAFDPEAVVALHLDIFLRGIAAHPEDHRA